MPKRFLKLLTSWTAIALLALVFIFMLVTEFNDWRKKHSVDTEIAQLTQQSQVLEQKNQEISNSLNFLGSSNFRETIAREQLNLKKDGELVYDLPDSVQNPNSLSANLKANEGQDGNPQKWYAYFFNK